MKQTKGFAAIGLIIVIIIALGITGTFYYLKYQKEEPKIINLQSVPAVKTTATTPVINIIATTTTSNFTVTLKGKWIQAREENANDNLVYKNSATYTPPPSRFRYYFIFKDNGVCGSLQLAANDGQFLKDVNCNLTIVNGTNFLNLDNNKYQIISQSTSTLILKEVIAETEQSCYSDSDCNCGINLKTKDCFFGNKKYVDTTKQCPDFCTGIAGNLAVKCLNNLCQQTKISK